MLGIFDAGNCRAAHLVQVKAAERRRHTDRDTGIGRNQNIREGGRQQGRFLHGSVVVVDHIDRVAVNVPEQLDAERVQLGLGVTRCGVCHITRVHLAKVTLGVDKRCQKRLVAAGQTDHRLIDGRIAVRV